MKLPVFPNLFPFNEMVFDGHLQIRDYAVKTRSYNWSYRGPVLFYTSGRVAHQAVKAYGYKSDPSRKKIIIGVADLVDVRELTFEEAKQMVCNFNNMKPREVDKFFRQHGLTDDPDRPFYVNGFGRIAPYRIGFFFRNPRRFETPVSFRWPPGPVRPIFTKVDEKSDLGIQLARVSAISV